MEEENSDDASLFCSPPFFIVLVIFTASLTSFPNDTKTTFVQREAPPKWKGKGEAR